MNTDLLSYHSPNLMKPEVLEALFVQRERLARDILDSIRVSVETPSKHYSLLIGPRGIGKTHMISLLYHRVKAMEDLQGKLHIAWLREEEWGVNSFLDLLLCVFRALGEETQAVAERIENLYQMTPDVAEHAAGQLLKEIIGDGTLLLLAENLDEMFAGLGDKGQKKLRSYIQENPFWTIVATAQSLFNSVARRTFPFYGFFTTHYLEEFSTDDVRELLVKIAEQKGDQELATFIQSPAGRARVRAIRHLAGGNPRIYVIFSQFLDCKSLDELVGAFIKMLDELTPYYQAKMKSLSPQQRKIIEFLCDYRGAAPVKMIAQRCFITHQTASSQLKNLREEKFVHSNPHGSLGRDSYYELHEPLMRLCIEVKKNRGEPIRLFADFLRVWYSKDELKDQLLQLGPTDLIEGMHIRYALELTDKDPRVEACLRDFERCYQMTQIQQGLQITEELVAIRGNVDDWYLRSHCFSKLGLDEQALACLDIAMRIDPTYVPIMVEHGVVLNKLGRYQEAVQSYDAVIACDPNIMEIVEELRNDLLEIINSENQLLRYRKRMLQLCKYGMKAFPSYFQPYFAYARALFDLGSWDEGFKALQDALHRFARTSEPVFGDTEAIIRDIFAQVSNNDLWRTRIRALVHLYSAYDAVGELGRGVASSFTAFEEKNITDSTAQFWLEVWRDLAVQYQELEIPVRLLGIGMQYMTTQDLRVLFELPFEERKVLSELLGLPDRLEG